MPRLKETGSLWDGRNYDIYVNREHYTLMINDVFYASGDTMAEIYEELESLAKTLREKKLRSMS